MGTITAIDRRSRSGGGKAAGGPDRVSVVLFSLAAFLVVLSLLASQLRVTSHHAVRRAQVIVRRVYRTTVIEDVVGRGAGASVSQSVSSSGSAAYAQAPAPVTRSS